MSDYTTNLAERTRYLHQLGYSPWMKDEPFKGLNVLEGPVSLLDFRKDPTTKINMQGKNPIGKGNFSSKRGRRTNSLDVR